MIYHISKTEAARVGFLVEAESEEEALDKVKNFISDSEGGGKFLAAINRNTRFDTTVSCRVFENMDDYHKTCGQIGIENLYPHDFQL